MVIVATLYPGCGLAMVSCTKPYLGYSLATIYAKQTIPQVQFVVGGNGFACYTGSITSFEAQHVSTELLPRGLSPYLDRRL